MRSIVVLQARTNSSRLPGKVLLPVCGLPLVVLAARRAENTGNKGISKHRLILGWCLSKVEKIVCVF